MGILDTIRSGVSDAVDSVTGGGDDDGGGSSRSRSSYGSGYSNTNGGSSSGESSSESSSSSSGGGRSIAERTADAGNSPSSSQSRSRDSGSGRSIAERTADAGNSPSSSGSSSGSSGGGSAGSAVDGSPNTGDAPSQVGGSPGRSTSSSSSSSGSSGGGRTQAAADSGVVDSVRDTVGGAVGGAVDTVTDPFERAVGFVRDDANDGPGAPQFDQVQSGSGPDRPTGVADLDDPDNTFGTAPAAESVAQPQQTGRRQSQGQGVIDATQLSDEQRQSVLEQLTADSPFGTEDVRVEQIEIGERPEEGAGVDAALSASEQQRLREQAAADSIFSADQIAISAVSETEDGQQRVEFSTPETNVDLDFTGPAGANSQQPVESGLGQSTRRGVGMESPAVSNTPSGETQTRELDRVSEFAGRDIDVEQGETFGDAQELDGLDRFFGDLADETAETTKAAGDVIGDALEDSARLAVSASPNTAPPSENVFDSDSQPDTATGEFASGAVQAASFPFAIPKKAVEGAEAGIYIANDPAKAGSELPGEVSDQLLTATEAAANNPAETAGALAASGGASSALFKATQGSRLGTASRVTLQPGEEAIKAGFRATGRAPDRPATAAQMVRQQVNLDTSEFIGDIRGQSQLGRQRSRSASEPEITPEIGGDEIVGDPFDSSPVRREFRERASIEPDATELNRLRDQTPAIDLRDRFDAPRSSQPLFGTSIEGSLRAASTVSQAQQPEVAAGAGSLGRSAVDTALGLESETDVLTRLESETAIGTELASETETETATETALESEIAIGTETALEAGFESEVGSESEFNFDFDEDTDQKNGGDIFSFASSDRVFSTGISDPGDVLDDLRF